MTKKDGYTSLRLPTILIKRVDELIKHPEISYTTRTSFIEDAVRQYIIKTEKDILDKIKIAEYYFKIRGV